MLAAPHTLLTETRSSPSAGVASIANSTVTVARNGKVHLRWAEVVFIVLFAALTTCLAWLARPYWDDGFVALFQSTEPPPVKYLSDRIIFGILLLWADRHLAVAIAIHFFGWFGMGLAASFLWSATFPRFSRFRLLAGLVALAPVICRFQMVLQDGALYLLQLDAVALAAGGFYWATVRRGRRVSQFLAAAGCTVLLFFSGLLTEYTLPGSFAASVVLWFLLGRADVPARSRIRTVGFFLLVAFSAYAAFWWSADVQVRLDVRPEHLLSKNGFFERTMLQIVSLGNNAWQVAFGRLLEGLGGLRLAGGKAGFFCLGAGLVTALLVSWISLRNREDQREGRTDWEAAGTFLFAIAAGLGPVILMGRDGSDTDVNTRFWLPVLPIGACLTVFILRSLVAERLALVAIALIGFLCGQAVAQLGYEEFHSARIAEAWGRYLHPRISSAGTNVAFFVYDAPRIGKCEPLESSYELTARLSTQWPVQDRNRFWAWSMPTNKDEMPTLPEEIRVRVRGVERTGQISKYFWVNVGKDGQIRRVLERDSPDGAWSDGSQ